MPDAFRPVGGPALSAGLGVDYLSCRRATAFNSTRPALQLVWTWAFVEPANASWTDPGTASFFTYEVLTDDAGLALALRRLGMPAQEAAVTRHPPLGPGVAMEGVTFEHAEVSVVLDWAPAPQAASSEPKLELRRHHWSEGPGGFVRVEARERDEFSAQDAQTPGRVSATGRSAFARVLGDAPVAGLGVFLPHATWEILGESTIFARNTT